MKTIYKKLLILVLLLPFSVLAQNTVTGSVVDKISGQPLPGVNVNVQGSSNGVSTGFDGQVCDQVRPLRLERGLLSGSRPSAVFSDSRRGGVGTLYLLGKQYSRT